MSMPAHNKSLDKTRVAGIYIIRRKVVRWSRSVGDRASGDLPSKLCDPSGCAAQCTEAPQRAREASPHSG